MRKVVIHQDLSAQRKVALLARLRGQPHIADQIEEYCDGVETAVEILDVLSMGNCPSRWGRIGSHPASKGCELLYGHHGPHTVVSGGNQYYWIDACPEAYSSESEIEGAMPSSGPSPQGHQEP